MATRRAPNARGGSVAESELPDLEVEADGHGGSEELAETRSLPIDRLNGTTLEIGGEEFVIGRISLDQIAAMARLAMKAARNMSEESKAELRQMAEQNVTNTAANIETLFSIFDGPTLNALFGIPLDRDADWVKRNVDLVSAVDILEAVLEHNEVRRLQAAFLRLTKLFGNSTQTSE